MPFANVGWPRRPAYTHDVTRTPIEADLLLAVTAVTAVTLAVTASAFGRKLESAPCQA